MLLYALRRLIYLVPVAFGVSLLVFALVHLAPGDPISAIVPPVGANWGVLKDDKLDAMINKAHTSFDKAEQTKALSDVHTYIVDQAYWVWIAHDLNPRAMSPKVKGFVQAQSWFQDLTPIELK